MIGSTWWEPAAVGRDAADVHEASAKTHLHRALQQGRGALRWFEREAVERAARDAARPS